jgi:hypothetical protein
MKSRGVPMNDGEHNLSSRSATRAKRTFSCRPRSTVATQCSSQKTGWRKATPDMGRKMGNGSKRAGRPYYTSHDGRTTELEHDEHPIGPLIFRCTKNEEIGNV